MKVLVQRPLGVKQGIDFDRVQAELIDPALASTGFPAGVMRDGGPADIVVRDISLETATLSQSPDAYQFVFISADPYGHEPVGEPPCRYDPANPGAARQSLVAVLQRAGSFVEEAERAADECQLGHLRLLALEVRDSQWAASALRILAQRLAACEQRRGAMTYQRAIVFTGHMVDAPNRPNPRFPQNKEPEAAQAIHDALREIVDGEPDSCLGLAGGASGGDILFHEACCQLGIPSRLCLAMPEGAFARRSVAPSGGNWMPRFTALAARSRSSIQVLCEGHDLPTWLKHKSGYNVWERTNLWLLEEAAANARSVLLMALWDHAGSDGPGGTGHLVETARQRNIRLRLLDTRKLFGF